MADRGLASRPTATAYSATAYTFRASVNYGISALVVAAAVPATHVDNFKHVPVNYGVATAVRFGPW